MLRSLLEDRFAIKVHNGKKEFPVYTLERGKRPFTLTKVEPASDDPDGTAVLPRQGTSGVNLRLARGSIFTLSDGNKLDIKGMNMTILASAISTFVNLPVVDHTEIDGFYDMHFDLSQEDFSLMMITAASKRGQQYPPQLLAQIESMTPSSLFGAMDKVGMKMEKGKAMLDVINIDSVNKLPTEN
jgi:uncharacterized protein (TIGR03435 family)